MRRTLCALVVAAVVLGGVAPATAAAQFPETIQLPNGFRPEGIDAGRGTTFYVGSLADGSIFRGDLRTGEGEVWAEPVGKSAVGLFYEAAGDRLWVAGGASGEVRVYDATSGELLATYSFPGSGFINDITVTRDAAYATDSAVQRLVVVPLESDGDLPAASAAYTLPLTGELDYTAGFNANGIESARGGRWLILVQSSTASLFRVDPVTGETRRIVLTGGDVANGDGLELVGNALYVVKNRQNRIARIRLAGDLLSGTVETHLSDSDFDVPTTVVFAAGRLWAVNARFGTPVTPETEYDVVQLRRR